MADEAVYDEAIDESVAEAGDEEAGDEEGDEDPNAELNAEIAALNKMIQDSEQTSEELAAAQKDAVSEAVLKQKQGAGAGAAAAVSSERDAKSIYIGNVDFSTTADELRKFFETCGAIESATVLLDKYTGKPKGYVRACTAQRRFHPPVSSTVECMCA
jgi:polyadenylate-binding protein 2